MRIDLTPIINACILFVAAVVSAYVIPWLKSKITKEKREELENWINIAVLAAEQIYNGIGRGEEKKAYVLQFLADKGYDVDTESINATIEAAVKSMNEEYKKEAA